MTRCGPACETSDTGLQSECTPDRSPMIIAFLDPVAVLGGIACGEAWWVWDCQCQDVPWLRPVIIEAFMVRPNEEALTKYIVCDREVVR